MSYEPEYPGMGYEPPPSDPGQRAVLPGIFLIVVGVLNLFSAIPLFGVGMFYNSLTPEQLDRELQKNPTWRKQLDDARQQGWTTQDFLNMYVYGGFGGGILALLASLPVIGGGIAMSLRKAYPLAMLGAITAAVPCVSPMSCCAIGFGVGIWALVVLMNPDVKAAFRGGR